MSTSNRVTWLAAIALLGAMIPGCGGGEFDTAEVSGRVTCEGEPIQGGQVLFRPFVEGSDERPGKSAIGHLNDNGEFAMLTTYDLGDGAVVGTHKVQVIPKGYFLDREDAEEEEEKQSSAPARRYPCIKGLGFTEYVVEVKEGEDNVLEIELSSAR